MESYAVNISFSVSEFMWTVFEKLRRASSATGIVEKEAIIVPGWRFGYFPTSK